jgi:hypothetical protein
MKNIHILPTDKPSRVFITKDEGLGFDNQMLENTELDCQNQNIYITSNEEIKEGWKGYAYKEDVKGEVFKHFYTTNKWYKDAKKIILTTDPQLIQDGVQAIDDTFLEWFVKNPSCEEIKVEEFEPIYGHQNNSSSVLYKIIIPKEEPNIIDQWLEKNGNPEITKQVDEEAKKLQKQHLIDMMKSDEELGLYEQTKCYCGHTTTCDCGPEQEITLEDIFNDEKRQGVKELIDKHNQETLKEAAERLVPQAGCELNNSEASYWQQGWIKGCVEGSKWQQENSYSEEDFKLFARQFYREIKMDKSNLLWEDLADKCLEQFKKK